MDNMTPLVLLSKAPTGIVGFDEITAGGLPAGRSTLVCGGAGCGKTLFAATFLMNGALHLDEPGLFMSFEEREVDLAVNVASLGYDVPALVVAKKLIIDHVQVEPSEIEENGEYDLEGLFLRIDYAVSSIGAKRVVLDTIETLFAGFSKVTLIRAELRRLFGWLKDHELTTVITGESGSGGLLTRHGLEEYVADCVVVLDNRVHEQTTTRRLRVMKYRGSAHGTDEYPFLIDREGITVFPPTSPQMSWPALTDIISTGIPTLDEMFHKRGLYRGSSILVSGGAGAGKTTMGSHFLNAACERGERCLFFGFEEGPNEHSRNALSVGIDLKKWTELGLLRMDVVRPNLYGLEMHLARIYETVEKFKPSLVIVDPISSFFGNISEVHGALLRILNVLKSSGTTALFTSLQGFGTSMDDSLSSLMDTWIKLVDVEANGERNHVLYVIKARGLSHSNQVREYRTTDVGIELINAYIGSDGVLTGAARLTQEARENAAVAERQNEVERRQREIVRQREMLISQITVLQVALEEKDNEAAKLLKQNDTRVEGLAISNRELNAYRATP
jgi:circadian clock protein KaiC